MIFLIQKIGFIAGIEKDKTVVLLIGINFISETEKSPMDQLLETCGTAHVLIPPRTPWHNGKVERSHRNDQRYFYDWEKFWSVEKLNEKLNMHLNWSNHKTMRTLGGKSPLQFLKEKLSA